MTFLTDKNKAKKIAILLMMVCFLFFGFSYVQAQAQYVGDYSKVVNGTLTYNDWNTLPIDFLNRNGTTAQMNANLIVGTWPSPQNSLTINGALVPNAGLSAMYITPATFNSAFGGGNFNFPGNLGIGTSSPAYHLSVVGDINFTGSLLNNGAPFTGSRWGLNGTSIYYNTGNVGIGTTNPQAPLHVNPATSLTSYKEVLRLGSTFGSYSGEMGIGFHFIGDTSEYARISAPISNVGENSGILAFSTLLGGVGLAERMRIDPYGNVGIGTTTPSEKLEVLGNIKLGSSITGGSLVGSATWNNGNFDIKPFSNLPVTQYGWRMDGSSAGSAKGMKFYLYGYNIEPNRAFSFIDGNSQTEIMRIEPYTRNVGIGTTTPSKKLHVSDGQIQFDGKAFGVSPGTSETLALTTVEYVNNMLSGASSTAVGFWTKNGDSIYNNNLGNVGIGTTNPNAKLDVAGVINGKNFALPNTNSTAQWAKIGTFYASQAGHTVSIKAFIHEGYNSQNNQDGIYYINFKTSNGSSVDPNGFAGNGSWYSIGHNMSVASGHIKWVANAAGNSANAYDLYIYLPVHTLNGYYSINVNDGASWVHSGMLGQVDPGNASATVLIPTPAFNFLQGNVGIGTTNPGYKLDVDGSGNFVGSLRVVPVGDNNGLYVGAAGSSPFNANIAEFRYLGNGNSIIIKRLPSGGSPSITTSSGTDLQFSTAGVNSQMTLNTSGNVGIGTTTPSRLLHVAGAAQFDAVSFGVTPGSTQSLALTTVEYVNGLFSTSTVGYWTASGNNIFNANSGSVGIGTSSYGSGNKLVIDGGALALNGAFKGSGSANSNYFEGKLGVYNLSAGASSLAVNGNATIGAAYFSETAPTNGLLVEGNIGVGIILPTEKLHVVGNTKIDGGMTLNGNLLMTSHTLTVNKITANTIDPLYTINGTKYSTFASAIVGGVTEEYVGRVYAKNFKKVFNEYEYIIDFSKLKEGSDLWVWHKTVDFSDDNVEIFLTPRRPASMYAFIQGSSLVLRSSQPVDASLRLIGRRFDWREWPTKAVDQNQSGGLVID